MAAKEPTGSAEQQKAVNVLRCLAADMPSQAKSGHPGAPIACAPMGYCLFTQHMNFNPEDPSWANRDRFILSNGHACALQYSLLHLVGYKVGLEDLKQFRQLGSITPGHPEPFATPGVEVATGPLGQGFCNAVGMAIAYEHLCSTFNKPDFTILDNNVYVIMGDGCHMEGVVSEAASLAGHLGLGNLVCLYDDNHISIAGGTDLAFTEDVGKRFESYGWEVLIVENGDTDLVAISEAIQKGKENKDKPTLVKVRTVIGFKAPKQNTASIHGSPLSGDDLKVLKKAYDLDPEQTFNIPEDTLAHYRACVDKGKKTQGEWEKKFAAYAEKYPEDAKEFKRRMNRELSLRCEALPKYTPNDKAMATREVGGQVLNALANVLPELIGGSADLGPSTKTDIKGSHDFQIGKRDGRIIRFGVREHAMCAIGNGMHAYGGVIPFVSTFLVFLSYCIASARLAALSRHQVLYIFTHDSIFVGEDGPTHQPIEILCQARSIPNFNVLRPADGTETVGAYLSALSHQHTPSLLALSRQALPQLEGTSIEGVGKGGYAIADGGDNVKVVLVASGSEVSLCVDASKKVEGGGVRVVSMPCMEAFDKQSVEYRESVFPPGVPVLSVEASSPNGWERYAHAHICVTTFGASAKAADLAKHFGFTVENVVEKVGVLVKAFEGEKAPVLTRRMIFSNTTALH